MAQVGPLGLPHPGPLPEGEGEGSVRLCSWTAGLLLAAALPLGGAWTADRLYPPNLSRLDAVGTEVLDRNGRLVALLPASGGVWRFRTGTADVSRPFLDLLVHTEDRRFWSHPGVDPLALVRAVGQWARAGRVVSGGSTLSMQAARLLEPRPRTLRSKLIEAARALQLEWRYGKGGVLGIWLTLAPYGGNLEGVRAGARAWFGTSAAALDPAQAALLVALPRRPEGLRPDRHPAAAERVRDRVLAEAAGVPVPARRVPFPRHAAQAVAGLGAAVQGGSPVLRTTLDLPLQAALERLAAERLDGMPERASVAILVADAATREVRAVVSGRWGDEARSGDVDLTRAVRSPGSALKPFLYAQAFADGVARPEGRLVDLPRHFGGYAPENFDHAHAGQVTAAEALRRSLNLPAVALLDLVGPLRFAEGLRAQGAKPRLPAGADPSLSLALGGAGLTMREVAGLYAGLVAPGWGPVRLLPGPRAGLGQGGGQDGGQRGGGVAEASRLVADILTQPFPSGGPADVGWKTGTSWGGRDAWAFGFDARQVAAVWVGRPDGTPLPGATGRSLALPLLGRVFDLLPPAPRVVAPGAARVAAGEAGSSLRLLFPPPDAVLAGDGPVLLRAMGGRRPLTFLVDGASLATVPAQRQASWVPGGPGFYAITVLDADGGSVRVPVRVR
jgi:penicillin-binding protein 1C